MIVDDEHALTHMMSDYLSLHGLLIETYNHPSLALDAFSKNFNNVDLVITDQTMPQMTGVALAENMLALKPDLPIILCSGFGKQGFQEKAEEIGVKSFFSKPVSMVELVLEIKSLLAAKAV
jgi:DNA-binding NtrC family response regulator